MKKSTPAGEAPAPDVVSVRFEEAHTHGGKDCVSGDTIVVPRAVADRIALRVKVTAEG